MLLQEGLLYWRKRSHKSELVTAFLLSDLVILAHDKGRGRYEYRSSVALDNCSLLVLGNSKGISRVRRCTRRREWLTRLDDRCRSVDLARVMW